MARIFLLATVALIATASGCAKPQSANQAAGNQVNQSSAAAPAKAAATPSERLLAAAEPFEALTETAFTDPPNKLDQTIGRGRQAIAGVRPLLTSSASRKVDGLLADIGRHRASNKRSDLALSSIEVYRVLVSSVPAGTKVPVEVSLLDYAGFRYQADLMSTPVRWDDMKQALSFARGQWRPLAPKVSDKAVSGPFDKALNDMEQALARRDPKMARSAVTAELNQVDKLESYFSVR